MFYGWIIALCGFMISVISFGARYSYGIFLRSLETEFEMTRAATSAIFSINMIIGAVISFLAGWALDKYGPRRIVLIMGIFTAVSMITTGMVNEAWQLLFTYSLLSAIGTGAIYGIVNATVSRWFMAKRGLAVGFSSSGGGIGIFIFSPLASYLILTYDWRVAFYTLGVASGIIIIALSFFLKKDPSELGLLPDGVKSRQTKSIKRPKSDLSLAQVFKTKQLWQLGALWLSVSIGVHLVIVHVVPYAVSKGISGMKAALIMSLFGLTSIFGRLLLGRLSDQFGRKFVGIICSLILCGILLFLIGARTLLMFYIFAVLFGLMWGGIGAVMTALVGDVFGLSRIGMIMGITASMWALGAAVGPALGGIIYDVSGYYATAFIVGAAGLLIAVALLTKIKPLQQAQTNE